MIGKLWKTFGKKGRTLKHLFNPKPKQNNIDSDPSPDHDLKLQKCYSNSMYSKIPVGAKPGVLITFSFTPRSYMKSLTTEYIETLLMPAEIVESESVWEAYSHFCSRIYEHDQAQGLLTEPWEQETDIYLWIKPYEEPTIERDMNGVPRRKVKKPTRRVNRLRRRTLFFKWMLENSDWQEQLVLHYWNRPRKGPGGEVLLPWFTLEVEYRRGARKKLYENWQFCTTGVDPQILGSSGKIEGGGENANPTSERSMLGALGLLTEGVLVETLGTDGDAGAGCGEYAPEVPQPLAEDGTALVTRRDEVSLVGSEAPVSYKGTLNVACEAVLKSDTSVVGDNKGLLGDETLAKSGQISVKSVGIKTPIPETQAGEIEHQPAVDVGVGEIEEFKLKLKEKRFLIAA